MFENDGHVHVYIAGAGAENPGGQFCFQKCNSSVNLVICSKIVPFDYFVTVFPFKRTDDPI